MHFPASLARRLRHLAASPKEKHQGHTLLYSLCRFVLRSPILPLGSVRMSLIGIDIGSSTTKMSAYSTGGTHLGTVYRASPPRHPQPGSWELDPNQVWNNAIDGLRELAAKRAVKRDPPIGIAVSASMREGFPVRSDGKPLGPCIMTADTRESGLEKEILSRYGPETWFSFCGHIPERMDMVCRLLWWEKNRPEVMEKARYFLGWAEYFSLRLTGRAVSDRSHAARWLVYDFRTDGWSPERMADLGINAGLLPEIQPWGTIIGTVDRKISGRIGLKHELELAVGSIDVYCSALGAGVSEGGTGCLISGSWEDIIVPVASPPPASELVKLGVSTTPFPGEAGWAILALNPAGNSVLNSVRNLMNVSLDGMDQKLEATGRGPGPVVAMPHFSGAFVPWTEATKLRGTLLGLTLGTGKIDVVKAFMESIAYDLYYTLAFLREKGVKIETLKGMGGGIASKWWTQLKADLTMTEIERVAQAEPGTLGAALLAGLALGVFKSVEEKAAAFSKAGQRFKPDPERASLYSERVRLYQILVSDLLRLDWDRIISVVSH